MLWFNKKKPQIPKHSPECEHKWQDFPWILHGDYDPVRHTEHITLTEPYVCIHCGKRKDVKLYELLRSAMSRDEAEKLYDTIYSKFSDRIEHAAIVEDMIADMQLVDREYLKYYNIVHGGADALERIKQGRGLEPIKKGGNG